MHLETLKELLHTYGANRTRWPEAVRADADALLQESPEAREQLRLAAELDDILDGLPTLTPSDELREKVVVSARATHKESSVSAAKRVEVSAGLIGQLNTWLSAQLQRHAWLNGQYGTVGVLAFSLVIGVAIGSYTEGTSARLLGDQAQSSSESELSDDDFIALAFGAPDYGY